MPITVDGTGNITGLAAGGLPDLSIETADLAAASVTTAKIADANVTASKMSGAQTGSAPIYAARAWVNFNGTGTVAIRASGNVTSITDNGTGTYTVNFSTALESANYATVGAAQRGVSNTRGCMFEVEPITAPTTTAVRVRSLTVDTSPAPLDASGVFVAVFV
jgi:hypothetical protein